MNGRCRDVCGLDWIGLDWIGSVCIILGVYAHSPLPLFFLLFLLWRCAALHALLAGLLPEKRMRDEGSFCGCVHISVNMYAAMRMNGRRIMVRGKVKVKSKITYLHGDPPTGLKSGSTSAGGRVEM
jgi:hypothetical protein